MPSSAPLALLEHRGVEAPRLSTPPLRELTEETTEGFRAIRFAEQVIGITLLPWQKWLLVHALETLPDGTFRFRTVILLVARQNGKSTILQILALFFMYVRGAPLVIGTAQNLDIAEEVWQGAVDIAEDVPELAAEIEDVVRGAGKKALVLKGRERYRVQSSNRRGGRGLSGDLVMLDELREHQSWDSWAAVTKTTLARPLAQIWAASNAGDAASVVLRHLRNMAHLQLGDPDNLGDAAVEAVPEDVEVDDSLGIFEWSAPPGCRLDDMEATALANPSLGHTITERALRSARRTDPEWVYRTEVLCQWWNGTVEGPFPAGTWEATTDADSSIPDGNRFVFAVDVSWDRSTAHIAVCGLREDGLPHLEVVASRVGTDWVVPWLTERKDTEGLAGVALQSKGAPVSSLLEDLREVVPVIEWGGPALGAGTGAFYDQIRAVQEHPEQGVRHRPQPVLDVAAATARTKPLNDSWVWDRRNSPTDIAPLVAVTCALWAFGASPPPRVSIYESQGLQTVG